MTVKTSESVCSDCGYMTCCNIIKRIIDISGKEPRDILDVTINRCDMKNCDRVWKDGNKEGGLFFCTKCRSMHRVDGKIGKLHRIHEMGYKEKDSVQKHDDDTNNMCKDGVCRIKI